MCGLAGFWQRGGCSAAHAQKVAACMAQRLIHRGPDDIGVWVDSGAGIALGHRRLSIIDLSPAGHQPMTSPSGRYVIVLNGEIYNHAEIRRSLCGSLYNWRGHSDTETLLAAIETWGIDAALKKAVGMFAIALWDRRKRTLSLARDRIGEKPLYYGWQGNTFLFGSELKVFSAHPAFRGEIDRNAITLLLRHSCISTPYSVYRNIYKLPPGTRLSLSLDKGASQPVPYWSLRDAAERGLAEPFVGSETDAVAEMEARLRESIGMQMMADVPLGAFLSGGVDSSTVVALMQAQSGRPVKTFTIGYHAPGYDEAQCAKAVAKHLGTDHTELYVTSKEAMDVIYRLPSLYDEPFSDSSQIPTFLVSQLARQHATVSLSGDGGDELFGGYNRYLALNQLKRWFGWAPLRIRRRIGSAIMAVPSNWIESLCRCISTGTPHPSAKAAKIAALLSSPSPEIAYNRLASHWVDPGDVVIHSPEPTSVMVDRLPWREFGSESAMMYWDMINYLPDDILVKVDRAAMSVGLETRVPFLDHRLIEFAWRLPLSMKIRNGQSKWILRQVLYRYVPKTLIERPKMGFGVPIGRWLRGPLRDWAESLLNKDRLVREGFFHHAPVRQKWTEHLSKKRDWQYHLWDILMFQQWFEHTNNDSRFGRSAELLKQSPIQPTTVLSPTLLTSQRTFPSQLENYGI